MEMSRPSNMEQPSSLPVRLLEGQPANGRVELILSISLRYVYKFVYTVKFRK